MSRLLYLEPVGGIAGDMFLAATLELGVPEHKLVEALSGLGLSGWRFEVSRQERHGVVGTHVDVKVDSSDEHSHRPLKEIEARIHAAPTLSARAKERALSVFRVLGEAEAHVHGVCVEEIEFHEVGAVDSIIDICGAAVALELLGDPEVYAAPPPLGSGTVRSAHGVIPVPAPATLEILRGLPVRFEGVGELTTPTGAALLKALARVGAPPEMVVEKIGYGVGTKQMADRPNVLRASLGSAAHAAGEGTYVLEANLDDCNPQLLGALVEKVLELGALDAWILPATMKKGRPGHLFGVLAPADKVEILRRALFAESTTLGVRSHRVERTALERRHEQVETRFGPIRVKLGFLDGQLMNAQPELEDCRARALAAKAPLKQVWAEALAAWFGRSATR